jgi:hypothetical protein
MVDQGLFALLAADPGVAALVPQGQIFAGDAPDDFALYPCISYSLVGGSSAPTLSTSGVIRQRIEINSCAAQPANNLSPGTLAAQIRAAVITAVNGWQQKLPDGTNVLNATLLNPGTDFISEQRIFRCMCEFYVLYTLA